MDRRTDRQRMKGKKYIDNERRDRRLKQLKDIFVDGLIGWQTDRQMDGITDRQLTGITDRQ